MKKVIALLLTLVCFATFAMAESVPSITTGDMVAITVDSTNLPEAASSLAIYTDDTQAAASELAKLQQAASVNAYFGDAAEAIKAIVGENMKVQELAGLKVTGYEESFGDVTATMKFPTPYEKDAKVAVAVGLVGANDTDWTVLEGVGTGEEGAVKVTFPAATLNAVQSGNAVIALIGQ